MTSRSCGACRYFNPRPDLGASLPADLAVHPGASVTYGECRAAAPMREVRGRYHHLPPDPMTAAWPTLPAGDWCGAFEPAGSRP